MVRRGEIARLTPENVCSTCVWQFDGQWWMRTVQANDDAGSEPSSWSLAAPLKEMASPTFQVAVESGAEMEAVGCGVARPDRLGIGARCSVGIGDPHQK